MTLGLLDRQALALMLADRGSTEWEWSTPGELAQYLDRTIRQTPALELIDEAIVRLVNTPDGRLIITMPPQEGKSTRGAKDLPTWLLKHDPTMRIVCASYSQSLANRNGRAIRNNITSHPQLGLRIAPDNGAVHEWELARNDDDDSDEPRGGVLSVGIGAGVTGRPCDFLIIDDPIKDRKEANSEVFRNSRWDWWTDSASTRLAPGAPVLVILTRWHEDDLAGRLLVAEDGDRWEVLNIPAQADHDPEKGETDVLGREPGEYMQSARINKKTGLPRSDAQWDAIKRNAGTRSWTALYQGAPSPGEGDILHREWWQFYDQPLWLVREDGSYITADLDAEVIMSWDCTFKDTESSDFVCGQVWMRRGVDAYLLDQVLDRMDFVRTCQEFRIMAARWPQATLKLVEEKANGAAVIASLRRAVSGIVPEIPTESKEARVYAVSPLVEAGNVHLPDPSLAPWVGKFIEECAAFPQGAHDDQVDAFSQALNRLILQPLMAGLIIEDEDLDPELADSSISPY